MVEVGTSYNKYLSPGAGAGAARVPVLGSMTLHLLASFDPVTGSYAAEFTLQLRWFDHRLSFNNLRAAPKINLIQPEQTEAIWFPHFVFDNTDTKKSLLQVPYSVNSPERAQYALHVYINRSPFSHYSLTIGCSAHHTQCCIHIWQAPLCVETQGTNWFSAGTMWAGMSGFSGWAGSSVDHVLTPAAG